jgi:hypothetical protein
MVSVAFQCKSAAPQVPRLIVHFMVGRGLLQEGVLRNYVCVLIQEQNLKQIYRKKPPWKKQSFKLTHSCRGIFLQGILKEKISDCLLCLYIIFIPMSSLGNVAFFFCSFNRILFYEILPTEIWHLLIYKKNYIMCIRSKIKDVLYQ